MTHPVLICSTFSYRDPEAAEAENRLESAMMVVGGEKVDGVWRRVGGCRHCLPWRPKSGPSNVYKSDTSHLLLASIMNHDTHAVVSDSE
jgi:hypothetical protein